MNTATRLSLFTGGLAAVFLAAYAVGSIVEPVSSSTSPRGHREAPETGQDHGDHPRPGAEGTALPAGLVVSEAGYTLRPSTTAVATGATVPYRFTVVGPDGRPVTSYVESHRKEMHLIVVRRDLDGYQHVHPRRAADGTWSVDLELTFGGVYRVFADFAPSALGRGVTLGADLFVHGAFAATPLPAAARSAEVGGYRVTVEGRPIAGETSELTFTVTSQAGAEVRSIEEYLGAFGHLVSLRAGDLAYLHTHPHEEAPVGARGGPTVAFGATFPTAGDYRLFFDFQVGGVVRTAEFTVEVATPAQAGDPEHDDHHDHDTKGSA